MIYEQNTLPISRIPDLRPTFQQFRERYGLSQYEVARQANVHVLFVYCMERGGVHRVYIRPELDEGIVTTRGLPCSHRTHAGDSSQKHRVAKRVISPA